jgi:hypothetical protein
VLARLEPLLADTTAGPPSAAALDILSELFGNPNAPGIRMAADALTLDVPRERVQAVSTGFVRDVIRALEAG